MKLYLKDARLSFTQSLFEAKQVQGQGEAKFSVSSIITPETKACFAEFNPDSARGREAGLKWGDAKEETTKAVLYAAEKKWGAKALEVVKQLKAADRLPVHDGDAKAATPGYAGNLYLNASNKVRPVVVSASGDEITASSGVIYPGCYAYVALEVWAQDNQFGKRVNASLLLVMFSKDGERLAGGGVATADDYAAIPAAAAEKVAASGGGAASLF